MPSLSPHAPASAATSPGHAQRPALMKRQSSQSSYQSSGRLAGTVTSPGSVEGHGQTLRHPVKTRHTKIVLPRNHSSGRNLAKLNRQAQQAQNVVDHGRRHSRQRSHEGDTEIRLPGSLDESTQKPLMRRNMTAYQLPRNTSNVKLKKNLSHGQLTRLGSGRNLVAMGEARQRAPPSPALKGKSKKRPQSAEITPVEKDLHEQEVELLQQRQQQESGRRSSGQKSKKVGFAVGSAGDVSDEDVTPQLEGHEDEWTEESASASPYSTRQNTANNSRRTSVVLERSSEKVGPAMEKLYEMGRGEHPRLGRSAEHQDTERMEKERQMRAHEQQNAAQSKRSERDSESSDGPSPRSGGQQGTEHLMRQPEEKRQPAQQTFQLRAGPRQESIPTPQEEEPEQVTLQLHPTAAQQKAPPTEEPKAKNRAASPKREEQQREDSQPSSTQASPPKTHQSSLYVTKESNPSMRRLVNRSQQLAPAVVSNISALDDLHSNRGSPAPSMRSSSNLDGTNDQLEDELVSRFVPSASHPQSVGSGGNTAHNTPKEGSGFHTPEQSNSHLSASHDQHDNKDHADNNAPSGFHVGPVSPGSTLSPTSSGAATPATARSRTELRMLQEKALAEMETQADAKPYLPAHIYDRRNESLKSYLQNVGGGAGQPNTGLGMGPDVFQGRFRALNTELRVVQKFRDPISEAVQRLRQCRGSKFNDRRPQTAKGRTVAAALHTSKSAVSLPAQRARHAGDLSKSASPPKMGVLQGAKSQVQLQGEGGGGGGGGSGGGGSQRQQQKPQGRREVSFAGSKPEVREFEREAEEMDPSEVARMIWESGS